MLFTYYSHATRQFLDNGVSEFLQAFYNLNAESLAYNLHIASLPIALWTAHDDLSQRWRMQAELEQAYWCLRGGVEIKHHHVGLGLLVELPLYLLTEGRKAGIFTPRAVPICAVRVVDCDGVLGKQGRERLPPVRRVGCAGCGAGKEDGLYAARRFLRGRVYDLAVMLRHARV